MAISIRFRKDHVCRHRMHVQSPGGIMLREYVCALHKNHPGPHMSANGEARWDNADRRMQKMEEAADNPERPRIFLAK